MAVPKGGHCDMGGYAAVLPFVQWVLQGKGSGGGFDDTGGWKAMPETYPWAAGMPS